MVAKKGEEPYNMCLVGGFKDVCIFENEAEPMGLKKQIVKNSSSYDSIHLEGIMQNQEHIIKQKKYLELLAGSYPTSQAACTEIINLSAVLNLPKGTEHFVSDLHGEYEVFTHIMKNASGSIKRKIDLCFEDTISKEEKNLLATIIYYPQEKLADIKAKGACTHEWYTTILMRLVLICRVATSKYTRSKVRKALPKDFLYIIDELLYTDNYEMNKQDYFLNILNTIITVNRADDFIIELSNLLQKMIVDKLHIIGDIFDRGYGAHLIMEDLCELNNVDFQWGNHDVVWMAAAHGHKASIANVIRNSIRYNNFISLEEGYGINIRPLAVFALEQYQGDPCTCFIPKTQNNDEKTKNIEEQNIELATKVHKAITVIQLKLEGQIIQKHPEFNMQDRLLLDKIDLQDASIMIDGVKYKMNDTLFPTVDPHNVYQLTKEEENVINQLQFSFLHNKQLHKHVNFLYQNGGVYKINNQNLLYHGCIPMSKNGAFVAFRFEGKEYKGKRYLDLCDKLCRVGAYGNGEEKNDALDFMWYLWCGPTSPLNGKTKMSTFERVFIKDENTWEEKKDYYYEHILQEKNAEKIINEFGIQAKNAHIINGHVPVKIKRGESPIKARGKVLIIDGGMSRAYQQVTGISGYTLVSNSYQLLISEHYPFKGVQAAIESDDDMHSKNILVENYEKRMTIADTDAGAEIIKKIEDLKLLVEGYGIGVIKQQ